MLYCIARHTFGISFENTNANEEHLRSYRPFIKAEGTEEFHVSVNDGYKAFQKESLRLIRDVDTGNGIISVWKHTADGTDDGYQFIVRNIQNQACALLIANETFTECRCATRGDEVNVQFGLNSALMLAYAFATARDNTLLVHASMVRHDGKAYAFVAQSGTGKSTHVANWLRCIENCDLMNDDNPIFRIIDGKVFAFGSPWSGKTPCYRNVEAELGGVGKIVRSETNHTCSMDALKAFAELLSSCSVMKWDTSLYRYIANTVSKIVREVPIYTVNCLPNEEAARISSTKMVSGSSKR